MDDEIELYPAVKAYPVMDASIQSEAVCVAGVTVNEPRRWVRLYPLDFRALPKAQQFEKWQPIRVRTRRSKHDSRPETLTPVLESVEIIGDTLGTDDQTWRRRLELLKPLMQASLCEIQEREREDGTSLGVFRPGAIEDFTIERVDDKKLAAKKGLIDQQALFGQKAKPLAPMPWKCSYRFHCDHSRCKGHHVSLIDWELGARWYNQLQYRSEEDAKAELYNRYFKVLCGPDRDVAFLTGNIAKHPTSFLILGVVWPRKQPPTLFED